MSLIYIQYSIDHSPQNFGELHQRCFHKGVWNSCSQNFVKNPEETYAVELSFHKIARLQPTSYCRTKSYYCWTNTSANTFLVVLRKERIFQDIENFNEKKLQKSPFFSKTTVCSSEFATSTKTDSNKNVSGEFSEVFANLSRKDP